MAVYKLKETIIPKLMKEKMNARTYHFSEQYAHYIYEIILTNIDYFLAEQLKQGISPSAVSVEDTKGNLLLAAVAKYHENEENPDMPGNLSYEMSFKDDILEGVQCVTKSTDQKYLMNFTNTAMSNGFNFFDNVAVLNVTEVAIKSLLEFLDTTVKEGEEVELEHEGYFKASAVVENGEKIFSITPGEDTKGRIKNDDTLTLVFEAFKK